MATNPTTMWTPTGGYLDPKNYEQGAVVNYLNDQGVAATSPLNPQQFATQATATGIAGNLGGTVVNQQLEGPGLSYSVPQAQISVPGAPSLLNAGLVAGAYGNYGTSPTGYGQYSVNRDITGSNQNYTPWALSQPGFQMSNTLANSGPGYNFVPDGKGGFINQAAPGGGSMTQQQAISYMQQANAPKPATAPTTSGYQSPYQPPSTTTPTTTRQSASQIGAAQNPYLSQGGNAYQPVADNQPVSNSLTRTTSRGYVSDIPASDVNYLDPNTSVPAPSSGTIFQGSDGTFYSWNGSGWDQSPEPPPGAQQQPDGSWSYGNTAPPDTGGGSPPPDTGGGGQLPPPNTGGTPTSRSGIPGQGFVPSGQYTPGSAWIPGGPTLPTGGGAYATWPYGANSPISPIFTQPDGEGLQYKAENDRAMAIQQGLSLQGDFGGYVNTQQGRANAYEGAANTAYEGIANGYGGYSDQEKAAIQNNAYLNGLQLTPEEMQGIYGDPYRAYQQLGLDEQSMDSATGSRYDAVRGAMNQGDTGINNALTDAGTNVRGSVYNQRTAMRNDLSDIAALTRGEQDQAEGNVRGALAGEDAYTRSYIDPVKLGLSDEYKNTYNVTPEDMQNIRNKAGRAVGSQEAMDEQNLAMAANAQGNTSPLAIESARARMRQQGAVASANAMSNADIAAKQLQLSTEQSRENTRLGAESNIANIGTGTELALGGRRTAAETQLGAQGLNNEQYMGNASLGTETTLGAAEQGAEQYLGAQQQQARQFQSSQRTAAEQTLGAANMASEQYKTGTNLAAGQQAEGAQQSRATQVAGNRQQTGQYIYGQTAQNNTNFATQRLTAEQEYRNYLAQQQGGANQNVTIGNQQRLGAYGTQTGAQNASTGTAIVNYKTPSATEKVLTGINPLKAKGDVVSGPQMAIVGEAGPELIVDLKKMPHYGEGVADVDPYGVDSDNPGSPGSDEMTGPRPKQKENPLYTALRKSTYGKYVPPSDDSSSSGGSSSGGSSGLGRELVKTGVKALIGLMAKGGVTVPHAKSPMKGMGPSFAKINTGHHPYGRRGAPKAGMVHPGVEIVTKPEVRMLGAKMPTAVIPLTRRPGNKVNIEDLPHLMDKYGV